MKYVPHAMTVATAGIVLTVRGMVVQKLWVNILGDVLVVVGMIWLFWAWDKLMNHVKAEKRRERRMDKLETACDNADMIARAADMKADEAKFEAKSRRQNIKGYVREGDQIINFRKEA